MSRTCDVLLGDWRKSSSKCIRPYAVSGANIISQLRELLLDVNESEIPPKHMLVNLTSSRPSENDWLKKAEVLSIDSDLERVLQEKGEEYDQAEGYCNMMKEYKQELRRGDGTLADYQTAYKTALPYFKITRSLGYLEDKIPHTRRDDLSSSSLPLEITEEAPLGFIGPQQEAEFLEKLDTEVAERLHTIAKAPGLGPPPMAPPPPNFAARDNPMSALNWLRKHQPQDFLPDGEVPAEKAEDGKKAPASQTASSATPASTNRREGGRSKRGSILQEVLDDEGYVIGHEPATRQRNSKRKRGNEDDDVAYHPSKGTAGKKRVRKSALELAAERD